MNSALSTPLDLFRSLASAHAGEDPALTSAETAAEEFGLAVPDALTGEFLRFLAARTAAAARAHARGETGGNGGTTPTAIVMSPACGAVGLHIYRGFHAAHAAAQPDEQTRGAAGGNANGGHTVGGAVVGSYVVGATGSGASYSAHEGHLTCIEPEVQHQQLAKAAFGEAGVPNNCYRFLPSAPLDVVGRLASDSYDLAVAECDVRDLAALCAATLPALRPGGTLVLLDSLMDGAIADEDDRDRMVVAAREADAAIAEMGNVVVTRLPLGAGATIITKL
ncbi:O-methyltransferase [Corynebacterium heidelbergense]|nr:O-methyltransferase [Corynebacterium heidelbergense]